MGLALANEKRQRKKEKIDIEKEKRKKKFQRFKCTSVKKIIILKQECPSVRVWVFAKGCFCHGFLDVLQI